MINPERKICFIVKTIGFDNERYALQELQIFLYIGEFEKELVGEALSFPSREFQLLLSINGLKLS